MKLMLMLLLGLASVQGNTVSGTPALSQPSVSYDQGKKIFVSRCAKCHDENARQALPDGSTLLSRLAKSDDPKRLLGTRLKDAGERDAVMEYLRSLMPHSPGEAANQRER